MDSPIKKVIVAGATGSVGTPILHALLACPTLSITILSRASSHAEFPPDIPVIRVSDDFTTSELTTAFTGQDAVVVALSTVPVTKEQGHTGLAYRLVDAALAAGVHRFIPSEYAANNLDPRARSLVPIYDRKGEMLSYLIAKCAEPGATLTWSSISCGLWLDWALDPAKSGNFLGIDVKARKATVYDSGAARFAVTTSGNAGLAVARVLLQPDLSRNTQIFLCDFTATTQDIVRELQRQTAETICVERKTSKDTLAALRQQYEDGDFNASLAILATTFGADIEAGYDFEADQELWNEKLGLPTTTLEEVVKRAVELAARG
ncbi:hypothetical protein ACN47E_004232 [Coniothyrium glycines]